MLAEQIYKSSFFDLLLAFCRMKWIKILRRVKWDEDTVFKLTLDELFAQEQSVYI